ncbi:SDR family NAD(P)-dependent oxidoreductase [Conexibacter woesei]|uniref:Short-chain dehydrogenase/reductase SDR n=1 Tax=Conexibacter woesei (strain DSM 14684 / CCUG 47730 / CIP 108061 / JCM 11494 / NBRC 100937 / ID131577) TaxID=469383 RepID=D3F4A1_CONWI|nr:SDR family NAD(P)-dependent oxidoreductase [Conexibacter woesei]ADB50473.1 short-chain dehydrogenase/reductase SDR [Conexibacter woesei DSM 14684]
MEIKGIAALVTGGASGLGHATALALAEAGARVTVGDLPAALAAAEPPAEVERVATDVTDAAQVTAAVAAAAARGPLRVVVNCAGIGLPRRILPKGRAVDVEAMTREIAVNLLGTIHVVTAAAPAIAAQDVLGEERGVIVNTASAAAFDGQLGQLGYAASKGGVVAATLPAARELASHRIRVVTIAPGLFDTPLLGTLSDEVRAALAAQVPHPARLGRPPEFALTVLQAIGNPLLNGEVIRLDGALRMGPG